MIDYLALAGHRPDHQSRGGPVPEGLGRGLALAGHRPDLTEQLMDTLHAMTDKRFRSTLKTQGYYIDWDEIAATMKGVSDSTKFIKPLDAPRETPFNHVDRALQAEAQKSAIDKVAPVIVPTITLDSPKSLEAVRNELSELIRDSSPDGGRGFWRLLGIVEQLMMHVQAIPKWTYTSVPNISPFPMVPLTNPVPQQWPPYQPYVGDPLPGSSTICSTRAETVKHGEVMCQADGHTDVDQFGTIKDNIPF